MLRTWFARAESLLNTQPRVVGGVIAICGLLWRFFYASTFYLDPDEAMHYTVATHDWHGLVGLYRNATLVVHPPLFILVLQGMLSLGRVEWVLRLVPMVAGAIFPWFVMIWLRGFAGSAAGLCAQLLLTFSPTLIGLSTEVRAYTLAFLFLSISLGLLERAINSGSVQYMVWFHAFLYLAILTEYSIAWFVAALGVYTLLRISSTRTAGSLRAVWALGQVGALGLYLFLYFTHIARYSFTGLEGMYSTWLQDAFPKPHEHVLIFALKGTYRQFIYLFQFRPVAWIGVIAFPCGLYRLWKESSLSYAILLVMPLCLGYLAAVLFLFPYGASRHTAVLGIAIAVIEGIAVAGATKNRIVPILATALPAIVVWNVLSTDAYLPIARYRHHRPAMNEATRFLRDSVPKGSVILTDADTDLIVGYYLGCPDYGFYDSDESYRLRQCAGLRFVVAPIMQFSRPEDIREALTHVRAKYPLDRSVWVAAGGFGSHLPVANQVSNSRPFGQTMAIFADSDSLPVPATNNQPQAGSS